MVNREYLVYGSILGVVLFGSFYFQTEGLQYTLSSKSAFITQSMVIYVPIFYMIFFKKMIDRYSLIGIVLAFSGVYFLTAVNTDLSQINYGDKLTVLCAILAALYVVLSSYYLKTKKLDPIVFSVVQFSFAGLISIVPTLLNQDYVTEVTFKIWWPLLFLGILNTGLGFLIQSFAHKYSNALKSSIIVSTEALFASIGAVVLVGEELTTNIIVGGLLVFVAVIIAETKLKFIKGVKLWRRED